MKRDLVPATNALPATPVSAAEIIAKYGDVLSISAINPNSLLVPREDIPVVIAAINGALALSASPEQLVRAIFPLRGMKVGNVIDSMEAYWAGLGEDLMEYPADAIAYAVRQCRRTEEWLPASAKVRSWAEVWVGERRRMIETAERMLMEHDRRRRAEEVKRAAEIERARLERENLERYTALLASLQAQGVDAPTLAEYQTAHERFSQALRSSHLLEWERALSDGARWALRACRRVAKLPELWLGCGWRVSHYDARDIFREENLSGSEEHARVA